MAPQAIKWGGRALFFALLLTQCGFLTAYPVQYKGPAWCSVFISYVPVCLIWLLSMYKRETKLRIFFFVWGFYIVCALLTNVIVIFGFVVDSLDKEKFLGPNVLKMVLCITPVLLILLMLTADYEDELREEKQKRRELVSKLCAQMAIDLLDTIEVLDIILEETEHNYGIKKGFGTGMTVVACLSFVLSLLQMTEIKFNADGKPEKTRYRTTLLRTAAEMVFVNFTFLIIRLVVFFSYGKDESIFIAKNGVAIVLSALQIYYDLYDRNQR
ncbi:uncharacterized protein [Montipora foliosa]|uniref:uncharacterized protein n=1 Tax=Montipora foliosa TaxID=591990 RepID=UPI0035F12924